MSRGLSSQAGRQGEVREDEVGRGGGCCSPDAPRSGLESRPPGSSGAEQLLLGERVLGGRAPWRTRLGLGRSEGAGGAESPRVPQTVPAPLQGSACTSTRSRIIRAPPSRTERSCRAGPRTPCVSRARSARRSTTTWRTTRTTTRRASGTWRRPSP